MILPSTMSGRCSRPWSLLAQLCGASCFCNSSLVHRPSSSLSAHVPSQLIAKFLQCTARSSNSEHGRAYRITIAGNIVEVVSMIRSYCLYRER